MSQETGVSKISDVSPVERISGIIAIGSNLYFEGDGPEIVLDAAFAILATRGFVIRRRSRNFRTPAFPAGAGPDFVNGAAVIESTGDIHHMLAQLHAVEAQLGRTREQRWGARTLDLDLIAVGQHVLPDAQTHQYWRDLTLEAQKTAVPPELILPHPRLEERGFVLAPLMDIAPEWSHPLTGRTVSEMYEALPQDALRDVVVL
jgi:2-amino-4-hydroxy-6-hydroxymethyldihydropteridine diphosphokinase